MSDNRFFSFVLYKRGLIALRKISAKISEERRALNKIQLLRGRKRRKFLTAPVVYYYKYKKRPDFWNTFCVLQKAIKKMPVFWNALVVLRKAIKKRLFFEMLCDIILVYEKNRDVSVVKTAYSPQAFGDFLIELKNKGGCLSVFWTIECCWDFCCSRISFAQTRINGKNKQKIYNLSVTVAMQRMTAVFATEFYANEE